MKFRFRFKDPNTGKTNRAYMCHDRKYPGNIFFTGPGFWITMTQPQAIQLANNIADLIDNPEPS